MTETLATQVKLACMQTVGADEHMQIANLIRCSKIHLVDSGVAAAAQEAVTDHTLSMERNLDLIVLPDQPTWFEWPLPPRNGRPYVMSGNERTGCLIAPHPQDSKLHMIISAWELDEGAMHAYGIALIARRDLVALAENARYQQGTSYEESVSRIMSMVAAFVPSAFDEEMKILSDGEDQSVAAMRDATAEVPMLLALMLLCQSRGGAVFRDTEDNLISVEMGERYQPSALARFSGAVFRRPKHGFIRLGRSSSAWARA